MCAELFNREPIDGSDSGIWGAYELEQNRIALGLLSARLYNSAGILYLSPGRIGLDPGNTRGIYKNTAAKSISLAAISNGNWFVVELSTLGSTPSITVSDLTGETNVESIPVAFAAAYDGEKGGYYITATKRVVGIGWKDSLGALGGVLNCYPGSNRYSGLITDSSNLFDYDFVNSELISNIEMTLTANKTLTGIKGKYVLHCNGGSDGFIVTLPSAVTYPYMEIIADKTDSYATNKSAVTLKSAQAIDDFTVQSTYYYIFLFEKRQYIKLRSTGAQYKIEGGWLDYSTGGINTADWTNRHLGDANVGYDNIVQDFVIGEKVTAASGNTGIVVDTDGSTLKLKKVTGTGIFADNEQLTGSWGGDALENVSTKDVDTYFYHNTGLAHSKLDLNLYIYESTTFDPLQSRKVGDAQFDSDDAMEPTYSFTQWGVDANNLYLQTGGAGLNIGSSTGGHLQVDAENYAYSIEARIYF